LKLNATFTFLSGQFSEVTENYDEVYSSFGEYQQYIQENKHTIDRQADTRPNIGNTFKCYH